MIALFALGMAAPPTLIERWDLESDSGSFSSYGDTAQWEWGTPLQEPIAYTGSRVWATRLGGDYLNDSVDYLEIPLPALADVASPTFRFWSWYAILPGDAAWVEVKDLEGWRRLDPVYGYPAAAGFVGQSEDWNPEAVDLRGLSDPTAIRLVFAADASGGAAGWSVDDLELWDGDIAAPHLLSAQAPSDTEDLEGPYPFQALIEDDYAVTQAILACTLGTESQEYSLVLDQDGWWKGELPGQLPDTDIACTLSASDGVNQATLGSYSFRTYLAAPGPISGPQGRVIGDSAVLNWTSPESSHPVLSYSVWRGNERLFEVQQPSASVPLQGAQDVYSVRAVYAEGEGDPTESYTVEAVVPRILSLQPASAWPGEQLHLRLTGEYLFLVEGQVQASLGEGISLASIEVQDVDTAVLEVELEAEALPGPRTLSLLTPIGVVSAEVFSVEDEGERPRIAAISPQKVTQGQQLSLRLELVGELATLPTVDLGEGLVVEKMQLQGEILELEVVVSPAAPLGLRPVELDDGERIFAGVELEVRDQVVSPSGNCSSTAAPSSLALLGLLALRRRKG